MTAPVTPATAYQATWVAALTLAAALAALAVQL
jgi:hypothetical protein